MNTHVMQVCKIGQGPLCCRYLLQGEKEDFTCIKMDPEFKVYLDRRLARNMSVAEGDNCEGKDLKKR